MYTMYIMAMTLLNVRLRKKIKFQNHVPIKPAEYTLLQAKSSWCVHGINRDLDLDLDLDLGFV